VRACVRVCARARVLCVFPGAYNDHNRKVEESYPQNQVYVCPLLCRIVLTTMSG